MFFVQRPSFRRRAIGCFLALVACGCSSNQKPPLEPEPPPEGHVAGTVCGVAPRADEQCSVLRDPFDDRGVAGCPDGRITFAPGADALGEPDNLLSALAIEMKRISRLTDVEIVAAAAPGETRSLLDKRIGRVINALVAHGLEQGRFSRAYQPTEPGPGYVFFVPFACDGVPLRR